MPRSLILLTLLGFTPFVPVASGGPQAPARVATGADTSGPPAPPAGFHHVKLNGHTFTLPAGFSIELAAGPPLADRPIVAAFDEKGRLYVCDSSGSNEKVAEQAKKKPHRIIRLEDTDGDGKYDKSTVFVANVMLPEGAMWLNGSLYVAAPPQILKFTDTDGDGKADKEEVWFDGKTLTGCANDLHGPYLGPDGWIYWCKGAFAKQEYTLPNRKPFTTRAAHIFRAKPDGSKMEPVMTGGMDNPVDVVFTPGGDRIFSTTFLQHPGNGKRDGLIHAVYGGVYGKDHDPVHEHPWTSPQLMPVMTHLGPAAPCGLHRYESGQFGAEYENNLFCCQFNMRKVSRHVLVPSGSTYTTKDSDFVVSDSLDFHPTDVIEDADGSLLVLDTGGWYKLCCPTSQLVKPDVTGAIYRVKKVGAHAVEDPRGLKIDWEKAPNYYGLLGDARPAVQQQAIAFCAGRGQKTARALLELVYIVDRDGQFRRNMLRTVARIDAPEARDLIRKTVESVNRDDTHLIALHAVSLWRDSAATPLLISQLTHESPHVRRVAAEALGRIGDAKAVPALIAALANETNDRPLDHALTYALIEIADPKATAAGFKHPSPRVRRAVLAALDQMPGDHLEPHAVLAELDAKDAALQETAWWIAGRHPQWGEQLAGYFRDRLKLIEKMTPAEQDELVGRFVPFLNGDAVRKAVGDALAELPDPAASRSLLRGLARSRVRAFPAEWTDGVRHALFSGDDDTMREAIAVLRAVPPTAADAAALIAKVHAYQRRVGKPWPKELDYAFRAIAPAGAPLSLVAAADVIADVHRDRSGPVRAAAADLLTRAALAPESLAALAAAFKTANPVEIAKLLPAFARSADEAVGRALVVALSDPALRAVVRAEQVKSILDKYPQPVRDQAEKLYALFAEARKGEQAKLEQIVKELPAGDVRRGQVVFNGAKAQCAACHKIGYVGGLVGPDLTRVGGIRADRDLLESIVFPSASFVRSYEPVRVTTIDGRTLHGILKVDAPDEIVLVVAADKEERVARADVESITPGTVSVMPAGLDTQLSRQDLADLVAFLKACK